MVYLKNYINGANTEPIGAQYIENIAPATGQVYSYIPDSDERDVAMAVQAASAAFPAWAATPVETRHDILYKIAQLIQENIVLLAQAESIDNGKTLALASNLDIPRAAANFKFFANAITQFASESHETDGIAINYTLRAPIGIVGCISPWNLPLYLFTWKIAPALAAGNTVIAKPSEITPMTAFLFSDLCTQAGLPKGVLNIVHGYGHKVGAAIVAHPSIKAISFTGGTQTGATIARIAAPMFKKLSLELGGKNPTLIFADCAYETTLTSVLRASFTNQGQICLCGSRIFIEKSIYKKFKRDFVEKVKQLRVGDPNSASTDVGAIVSLAHQQKILSYIQLAKDEGGTIICGGKTVTVEGLEGGYFVAPTVIEGLGVDCRVNQEEIFGPVVTLIPFTSEAEVLDYANSVTYGLSCSVWTQNLSRAHRIAAAIQTGIVWVNTWLLRDLRTPFGGMKESGVGREGGWEALRFFTEAKNVCIKYDNN
jgi:aminomuconate-semialdehyde/2-hydroxymuconate-6-semialdehyde dehydrogenase